MKLASRMSFLEQEGAFAVLAKAQELERNGKKIIHLEIGQPDFDTPKHISKAAILAIKQGKTRYTPSLGIHQLRIAIADYYSKTRNTDVDYKQVAVTPSCKTALFTALAAVVEPGDEVLYPDPGFPAYKILIEFFGGRAVPIPLIEERNFSFDMKEFKKKISSKTKAVIINSPGNPTGSIIPRKDLEEIASLILKYDSLVISDEIYSQIIYGKEPVTSIYSLPKMKNRTIVVDGFSKSYAMTGWRLGYLIAPEKNMQKIDYFLTHSVACTATFTQEAGLVALNSTQKEVKKMIKEFKKRRDLVVEKLNKIKGVTCLVPEGAFYVFPNIKSFGKSSKKISDYLLNEGNVAVLDGTSFGKYGEGYLRLSYAASIGTLEEGLNRIRSGLQKLQ